MGEVQSLVSVMLQRLLARLLIAIIASGCLASHAQGASIESVYPDRGSTYGGTHLVVTGSGFLFPSEGNPWDSQEVFVGNVLCKTLEHFTNATQIVCLTGPSPLGPFGQTEPLTVRVQLFSGVGAATYAEMANAFRYHGEPKIRSYPGNTPVVHWAQQWAGTPGDLLQFAGFVGTQSDGSADKFEIRIRDVRCRTDEEVWPISTRRRGGQRQVLKGVRCELPDEALLPAGHHNVSMRWHAVDPSSESCSSGACFPRSARDMEGLPDEGWGGYGAGAVVLPPYDENKARLWLQWGGLLDLATMTSYHFTLYPQVNSVEPLEGGVFGGNKLTIHGAAFSEIAEENEVTVGGVPCPVVFASRTKLMCVLGDGTSRTPEGSGTLRGLLATTYTSAPGSGVPDAATTDDSFYSSNAVTATWREVLKGKIDFLNVSDYDSKFIGNTTDEKMMRESIGFFRPPLTARYSFYVAGDDAVALDVGTDSSVASLRRLATVHSPFAVFWDSDGESNPLAFLQGSDLEGGGVAGPDRQISLPTYFEAGRSYAFRLRHTDHGGGRGKSWTRISMRVAGLGSARTEAGEALSVEQISRATAAQPAMEVQLLRLRPRNLQREKHFLSVDDANAGGSFRLRLITPGGSEAIVSVPASLSAQEVQAAIRNVKPTGSGWKMFNYCNNVGPGVTFELADESTNAQGKVSRVVHITFDCPLKAGLATHATMEIFASGAEEARTAVLQLASTPLSGSFRVGYDGAWSEAMAGGAKAVDLLPVVRRIGEDALEDVELEFWRVVAQPHAGEGFDILVRFRRPHKDVGDVEIDSSGMLGDHEFTVLPVINGDADAVHLERVPADLFEMPYPTDSSLSVVRVVTNGVVAAPLDEQLPTYKYSEGLSPILHSATPSQVNAGSVLTVEVENLLPGTSQGSLDLSSVLISLGDGAARCGDLRDVSTDDPESHRLLECVVEPGVAGDHSVRLLSTARGFADPSVQFQVTYGVTLDLISPLSGSLIGGTLITLLGDGLAGQSCESVTLAGTPCLDFASAGLQESRASAAGSLVCVTPSADRAGASEGSVDADIQLRHPLSEASLIRGTFTYAEQLTPLVDSVVPASFSAALSTDLTLTGSGFAGEEAPLVMIGERKCKVKSYTDSSISCWLPRTAPTPPDVTTVKPTVWVPALGFSDASQSPSVTSQFEVNTIAPARGSRAGGTVLTIQGAGFHPTLATKHVVSLTLADRTTRSCAIIDGTGTTQLRCRIEGAHTDVGVGDSAARRLAALQAAGVPGAADGARCFEGRCFAQALLSSGELRAGAGAEQHHTVRSLEASSAAARHGPKAAVAATRQRRLSEALESSARSLEESDMDAAILSMSLNGVEAALVPASAGSFSFSEEVTRTVLAVSPLSGSYQDGTNVLLTVQGEVATTAGLHVFFGDHECPVGGASFDGASGTSTVSVALCEFEASLVPVYLCEDPYGYASGASRYTGASFSFRQVLLISSVSPAMGSYFGGTELSILGAGFHPSTAARTSVMLGDWPCMVISSTLSEVKCITQPVPPTAAAADVVGKPMALSAWLTREGYEVDEEARGLRAQFYDLALAGIDNPRADRAVLDGISPVLTRTDPQVDYEWTFDAWPGLEGLVDRFAARWTGFVVIQAAGMYSFSLDSDDGSLLYIDGAVVVDRWAGQAGPSAPFHMLPGVHALLLDYYEMTWVAGCQLRYSGPDTGGETVVIPSNALISSVQTAAESGVTFSYEAAALAPQLQELVVLESGTLELHGTGFGTELGKVALGSASFPSSNFLCEVTSWADEVVLCLLPAMPAGSWQVRLWSSSGWSSTLPSLFKTGLTVEEIEANRVVVAQDAGKDPWRLVMKIKGEGSTFGFDSEHWTGDTTLNADSDDEDEVADAKYEAFNSLPFRRMHVCVGSPRGNCVEHLFQNTVPSALELFSSGQVIDLGMEKAAILEAFGVQQYSPCPMQRPGFNVVCPDGVRKARWGFCNVCPTATCQDFDGRPDDGSSRVPFSPIGVGLLDSWNRNVGAGFGAIFQTCGGQPTQRRNVWLWVEGEATAPTAFHSGLGGGLQLSLRGSGFGLLPAETSVRVCGEACQVISSSTSGVVCQTPPRRTAELIDAFPSVFGVSDLASAAARFYSDQGETEAPVSRAAFTSSIDNEVNLHYLGAWHTRPTCWFAFELPRTKRALVRSFDFYPPTDPSMREKVMNSVLEVRNLTGDSAWLVVARINDSIVTGSTIAQGWSSFPLEAQMSAQAFRLRILSEGCGKSGELFRGARVNGVLLDVEDSGVCRVDVPRVFHPLASAPSDFTWVSAEIVHSLARTPLLVSLSPSRGTARGGSLVQLRGRGLEPLSAEGSPLPEASELQVLFNGYDCLPTSVGDTVAECMTTERSNGITPASTSVWLAGRGFALVVGAQEATTFKYLDKWSDVRSWLNSEPPVDGDSVIVPEGQAILLDEQPPRLFLLLISGYMEFDRRDLALNATYIWVAGGHLSIGTEEAPFLQKATITLHGDRWNTVEIPFVGSKMLALTNLGGLHGGCHNNRLRLSSQDEEYEAKADYCPVRSVGRLDLHGKPGLSWTRLTRTVQPGDTSLHLAEPANWEAGDRIVITQSDRGEEEEVRRVRAVTAEGLVVEVDEPLERAHLGEWYFHDSVSTPTDLRAAVGLLTRNVKIQGDDASERPGSAYMFGAHVGAFMGGEMRIENTEFFRTGQAASVGRYSSHFHLLSPGRDVDVVDKAYLRNNSYHDTFQRAVVIHGTDYAVVKHNVAHRVKGHMYFTESGAEHFALFEHNLAVHSIPHHLLLGDDGQPAGFWLPGFTGWHRSNLAAGCTQGWRLRVLNGPGRLQSDLTFFNNSAHACGWGWHLKPPHGPKTVNTFKSFTMFRCNRGMFYYSTHNLIHEDHRFVECNLAHDQVHSDSGLHAAPFYVDALLVGSVDPDATEAPRPWLGMRTPRDNEYFYVSGLKVINYFSTPVLYGCYFTTCTIRVERCEWHNSEVRTISNLVGDSGIYWDVDGSLTGYPNGFVSSYRAYNHFPGVCEVQPAHGHGLVCGLPDGSVRVRRLIVGDQAPWQLGWKTLRIVSAAGEDTSDYSFSHYPTPILEGQEYSASIDDPNDFQVLSLTYGVRDLVTEEWGWVHHTVEPRSEGVVMHLSYSDWQDHFNASVGTALEREPTFGDDFGAHAIKLSPEECAELSLPRTVTGRCGQYVPSTGLALKFAIEALPELPQPSGTLTTALYVRMARGADGGWTAQGVPIEGALKQNFSAMECPVTGCSMPSALVAGSPMRLWSDASRWPSGALPGEGDNVEIAEEDAVLLDIDTPKLHWLTINGHLKVAREVSTTINVHSIKVWGELDVGSEEDPIPAGVQATIAFHGDEAASTQTVVMSEGLFLGSKVLAVLGTFTAVGTPVTNTTWAKLKTTADVDTTTLVVRGNLSSWPVGGEISISSTEYPQPPESTATELRRIVQQPSYNAAEGSTTIEIDQPLLHRHFAGRISPSEDGHWQSASLSAAVALLSGRTNVLIKTAEEGTEFGGTVVIGGSRDAEWQGSATLKDVDFLRMGKGLYQQPALLFDFLGFWANLGTHPACRVERCAFRESQSGAIEARRAGDLSILDSVFHRTYRSAVWLRGNCARQRISLLRNAAMETLRFRLETTTFVRPFAAFYLQVVTAVLEGNLAAGSTDSGFLLVPSSAACFVAPGNNFWQEEQLNEAVGCMTGFFLLPVCNQQCRNCAQLWGAVAWKNSHAGVMTVDQTGSTRLDTLLLADNHIGITLNSVRSQTNLDHRIYANNISIFGATPASTCQASTQCRAFGRSDTVGEACNSVLGAGYRHVGVLGHITTVAGKTCGRKACPDSPATPVKLCVMPWEHRLSTIGAAYSEALWTKVTFGAFSSGSCGQSSVAFMSNPTNLDMAYPNRFSDVRWLSSVSEASRMLLGQDGITGNRVSCGGTCDSHQQLALTDLDGSLLGTGRAGGSAVTAENPALATAGCIPRPGYFACDDLKLRYLKWMPLASNLATGPMKAWRASDGTATWSIGARGDACVPKNPPEDRSVLLRPTDYYNITLFGSAPDVQRLHFMTDDAEDVVRLDLFLTQPFGIEVYVDGALLPEEEYDTARAPAPGPEASQPTIPGVPMQGTDGARLPSLSDPHGSYTFDPHARRLYLVMKGGKHGRKWATAGGGLVVLRMTPVVQLSLGVSGSEDEPFDGRHLIQNLTTLLQIHPSRIKIVSVQSNAQVAGGNRRLAERSVMIVQLLPESPEALPESAFDVGEASEEEDEDDFGRDSAGDDVAGGTLVNATPSVVSQSDAFAELQHLAHEIEEAASSGALNAVLGPDITLDDVEVASPDAVLAMETTTTTEAAEDALSSRTSSARGQLSCLMIAVFLTFGS